MTALPSSTDASAGAAAGIATPVAPRPATSLSDFCAVFPKLEPAQQERFRETVTRLLAGHILEPGSAFRPDPAWQFADRFSDLLDGYLRIGGWRLEIDRQLGVARVVHEAGEQRVRLNRLESVTLCVLRLIYHEQKLVLGEDDVCRVAVGEVRERLIHAGLNALDVSKRQLLQALRALDRYHLIAVERGFDGDDAEVITVSPVVERVLSADRVEAELKAITARRGELEEARSAQHPDAHDGDGVPEDDDDPPGLAMGNASDERASVDTTTNPGGATNAHA